MSLFKLVATAMVTVVQERQRLIQANSQYQLHLIVDVYFKLKSHNVDVGNLLT